MTDLIDVLRDRRSVRSYDPGHRIDEADLASLLEAARWAPSAGNSQPWAFLLAPRGSAAHATFGGLLAGSVRRWALDASLLVFALHQVAADADDGLAVGYSDYAAYDLGQAVAHLTVQAAHLGLGCHQFAAFDHAGVAAAAHVPAHWQVSTGIAVGRGIESELAPRTRKPLAEMAFGATFGEPVYDAP